MKILGKSSSNNLGLDYDHISRTSGFKVLCDGLTKDVSPSLDQEQTSKKLADEKQAKLDLIQKKKAEKEAITGVEVMIKTATLKDVSEEVLTKQLKHCMTLGQQGVPQSLSVKSAVKNCKTLSAKFLNSPSPSSIMFCASAVSVSIRSISDKIFRITIFSQYEIFRITILSQYEIY